MDAGIPVRRVLPNLLLAALLLAAQFAATVHAAVHEQGVPQSTVCNTCVAADQLAAASVDQFEAPAIDTAGPCPGNRPAAVFHAVRTSPVRQRGPPVAARDFW